jgi:hypothetical protein
VLLLAQSIGEYGGAGGGIVGAIETLTGQVVGTVSDSFQRHTIVWIACGLVVAFLLFKRR